MLIIFIKWCFKITVLILVSTLVFYQVWFSWVSWDYLKIVNFFTVNVKLMLLHRLRLNRLCFVPTQIKKVHLVVVLTLSRQSKHSHVLGLPEFDGFRTIKFSICFKFCYEILLFSYINLYLNFKCIRFYLSLVPKLKYSTLSAFWKGCYPTTSHILLVQTI
jgi:hypothetical protein